MTDTTPIALLPAAEAAAVLYRLVNGGVGTWVPGQRTDAGVNWRLAGVDVAAERQVLHVGGQPFGVWSCVAPPAQVAANALADLYGGVQAPMTVVLEWRPWTRSAARRKMRSAQRHYFSKRYSMAAHLQEKEGTSAAMEDAAASIEAERAGAALVELETDGVAYGEVALSVVICGTPDRLDQWGAELSRVFGALDAKVTRETYGQLAVWFGRLPGQPRSRQPRTVFVSAGVAAAVAPLFGAPIGNRRCEHLDAPALTVFETPSATPYYYDLFGGRDVGHTLMLGATGAGKSFALNYLLVQALQYQPRVLILDLGGSYRGTDPVPRRRVPRGESGAGRDQTAAIRARPHGADDAIPLGVGAAVAQDRRVGGAERRSVGGPIADRGFVCVAPAAAGAREPGALTPASHVAGAVALARYRGLGALV